MTYRMHNLRSDRHENVRLTRRLSTAFVLLLLEVSVQACAHQNTPPFEGWHYPVVQAQSSVMQGDGQGITDPDLGSKETSGEETPALTAGDYLQMGEQAEKQGNFPMALTSYQKALDNGGTTADIRYKIGALLLKIGSSKEALEHFSAVLSQDPDHFPSLVGKGKALYLLGKMTEAQTDLEQVLQHNPNSWEAHAVLGILHDQLGNHGEALAHHQAALAHRQNHPDLLNNLGMSYLMGNKVPEAIQAFQSAVRTGVSSPVLYNNLGLALTKAGQYDEAIQAFKMAGSTAQAYNNVGTVLLASGHAPEAIPCFEQALDANPTFYVKANENLKQARRQLFHDAQNQKLSSVASVSPCSAHFQ